MREIWRSIKLELSAKTMDLSFTFSTITSNSLRGGRLGGWISYRLPKDMAYCFRSLDPGRRVSWNWQE